MTALGSNGDGWCGARGGRGCWLKLGSGSCEVSQERARIEREESWIDGLLCVPQTPFGPASGLMLRV